MVNTCLGPQTDLPSLLVYPVNCWVFLPPSTDLLGGRTFLLVFNFLYFNFFLIFISFLCVDSLSDNRLAEACN